jgi:protoporphyrinogen oxidase
MPGIRISYPPNLLNLFKTLPLKKSLLYTLSLLERFRYPKDTTNYKSAMLHKVGKRIYEGFFHEYIYKLWGIAPENIAIEGMKRRKTLLNLKSVIKSIAGKHNYFYYPKNGIGAIADALANKIECNDGTIYCNSEVSSIKINACNSISSITVTCGSQKRLTFQDPLVLSTIPIDEMFQIAFPYLSVPPLMWRDLRVVYIHIADILDLRNETFYLPARDTACGRISFIQKYSPFLNATIDGTIITCEFPTSQGDEIWEMDDTSMSNLCINSIIKEGILSKSPEIISSHSIKVKKAYPIYTTNWKDCYNNYYNSLLNIQNLCIFGRRGLFLHCNIDHAIRQGFEIAKIINGQQQFHSELWNSRVKHFSTCSARD